MTEERGGRKEAAKLLSSASSTTSTSYSRFSCPHVLLINRLYQGQLLQQHEAPRDKSHGPALGHPEALRDPQEPPVEDRPSQDHHHLPLRLSHPLREQQQPGWKTFQNQLDQLLPERQEWLQFQVKQEQHDDADHSVLVVGILQHIRISE